VAVVELVSPGNKKEADERVQFVAKCLSYLGRGLGLVVVDTLTERRWKLAQRTGTDRGVRSRTRNAGRPAHLRDSLPAGAEE